MTACSDFYAGYRWRTALGALMKENCNTCSPSAPPGYSYSVLDRVFISPAGVRYSSQDAAWSAYCVSEPSPPPGTGTNNNALLIVAGLAIAYLAFKGKLK